MIKVCVAGVSTILEPSAVASTAAACTGFLGSAALGTRAAAAGGG